MLVPENRQKSDSCKSDSEEAIAPSSMKQRKTMSLKWTKGVPQMPSPLAFPDTHYDKYASLDPVELFEFFLDDHIFKHIVEQSRLYSVSKNWPDPNISEEEIECISWYTDSVWI